MVTCGSPSCTRPSELETGGLQHVPHEADRNRVADAARAGNGRLLGLLYVNAVYILGSVGVLGGGFMILARKIRGSAEFKKALMLGLGWLFFGVSGALDALLSEGFPIIIAPARALMLAAYILIFLGFNPSKK